MSAALSFAIVQSGRLSSSSGRVWQSSTIFESSLRRGGAATRELAPE